MLRFSLWRGQEAASHSLADLWKQPDVIAELQELLPILRERIGHTPLPLPEHPDVPLFVHCHYSLAEILGAFGILTECRIYWITMSALASG